MPEALDCHVKPRPCQTGGAGTTEGWALDQGLLRGKRLSQKLLQWGWHLDNRRRLWRDWRLGWMLVEGSTCPTSTKPNLKGGSGLNGCSPDEFPHMYCAHASWSLNCTPRIDLWYCQTGVNSLGLKKTNLFLLLNCVKGAWEHRKTMWQTKKSVKMKGVFKSWSIRASNCCQQCPYQWLSYLQHSQWSSILRCWLKR